MVMMMSLTDQYGGDNDSLVLRAVDADPGREVCAVGSPASSSFQAGLRQFQQVQAEPGAPVLRVELDVTGQTTLVFRLVTSKQRD